MHTFEIRFAKSEGLAGLFEAPANRLGWKGSGLLSIDGQGISIAVKRGLLTLFSRRSRRFPSESLTEAYREGDALRLVFGSRDQHEILAVWARGGEAAADIVKLLPTLRTVELDESTAATRRYRFDWRTALLLLAPAVVVAAGAALLLRKPRVDLPAPGATSVTQALPEASASTDEPGAAPGIAQAEARAGTPGSSRPQGEQRSTSAATSPALGPNLEAEPRTDVGHAQEGAVAAPDYEEPAYAPADSAERPAPVVQAPAPAAEPMSPGDAAILLLRRFEQQSARGIDDDGWWQFTVYVHTAPELQQQELWITREAMLAVSRAWRAHDREFAEKLTDQVHSIIR